MKYPTPEIYRVGEDPNIEAFVAEKKFLDEALDDVAKLETMFPLEEVSPSRITHIMCRNV